MTIKELCEKHNLNWAGVCNLVMEILAMNGYSELDMDILTEGDKEIENLISEYNRGVFKR